MSEVKPKHIVVFGANGGIGQAVVNQLAAAVEDGANYKISLVMRKHDKGNFIHGLINEVLDGASLDPQKKDNLMLALDHGQHAYMEAGDLSSLESVLKDADVVISAGGLPRPPQVNGKEVPRDALIYPNSNVINPIARAMARYAPANAVLMVNTNPLDNMVQAADETLHNEWIKAGRTEKLPDVKVVGMSSTLDTLRVQKFTSRALNAALKQVGSPIRFNHARDEVKATVYGQHGPNMAIDFENMNVAPMGHEPMLLKEFIELNGLKEIKIPFIEKGEEKQLSIFEVIEKSGKSAGSQQIADMGRSAQTSTAKRIVEMTNQLCSYEMHDSLGSITSGFLSDVTPVAYGRPIKLGKGKAELADFPAYIQEGAEITTKIKTARAAIDKEQQTYNDNFRDEEKIGTLLGAGRLEISRSNGHAIFKIKHDRENRIDASIVTDQLIPALSKLLGVKVVNEVETESSQVRAYTLSTAELTPMAKASLDTLAGALGITIQGGGLHR